MSVLLGSGFSVFKRGKKIYSKDFTDNFKNLAEVVYCKGAYFIYNYNPGRILRKIEDWSEPVVWWDKQKILNVWNYTKNLRVNREGTALIVNLNQTDLVVIEVIDDGDAGRELVIKNKSAGRINCHEALLRGRILAVTDEGELQIYKVDYLEYSGSTLLKSCQIAFGFDFESCKLDQDYWLAVCEKSQICAVQVSLKKLGIASRILIYQLRDRQGQDVLAFQTQIDLASQQLSYLGNGCFSPYIGDKLVLCTQTSSNQAVIAFGYDLKKRELTQIEKKSLRKGNYCWKLSRVGNQVCGIIQNGGFILRFKFSVIF